MTIVELAEAAGVSVASANRFAVVQRFECYADLRAELTASIVGLIAIVEGVTGFVAKRSPDALQRLKALSRKVDRFVYPAAPQELHSPTQLENDDEQTQ
jgi:DNA-binding MurR/RpiR family transcriptional regulator